MFGRMSVAICYDGWSCAAQCRRGTFLADQGFAGSIAPVNLVRRKSCLAVESSAAATIADHLSI